MKYAIVYSSRTGNTKLLAEAIQAALPAEECIYFGEPNDAALKAERIYAGFWTDKGSCDEKIADFLKQITNQSVFLFGTAGFGGNQQYFDQVLERAATNIGEGVNLVGTFMCQGKMPMSVRRSYEEMLNRPNQAGNAQAMIENFDKALAHPDQNDLENLKKVVQA